MNTAWKRANIEMSIKAFFYFLLMDDVTSMGLVGSRSIAHSLTHSILITLFIKLELSNFLLPPLLSIVFVQECSVVLKKVFGEGRLGRRTFLPKKWERVCRAHWPLWFHVVLFRKCVVFCSHVDESW